MFDANPDPQLLPQPIDPRDLPARNAVAIYLMELQQPASLAQTDTYLPLLAIGEQARWREIRPKERQWQYLQSRVLQRLVLGAYVDDDPRALAFTRDRWGRPSLADHDQLHFSLSHCASHVALAIGSDPVLGVDVETVVPVRPSFMRIARQFFHEADLAQVLECPEERRYSRFLELWTLKEAYLKALGLGMHKPMADCGFARTDQGLILAQDRAPVPDLPAPDAFIAQRRMRSCQLAVAYRQGRPVRFRYLNGNGSLHWPGTG
jgi:4'-phosphopantetheinyl transferase